VNVYAFFEFLFFANVSVILALSGCSYFRPVLKSVLQSRGKSIDVNFKKYWISWGNDFPVGAVHPRHVVSPVV